jgi:proteasome assembly chaperone (PAC2) family protein
MPQSPKLHHPWLVAVWPGMGSVAVTAGYYLMAKLGMHLLAEYNAGDLFDVNHVEVKAGLIQGGRMPRNRFFVWKDPKHQHDVVVFLGEAQPPLGKYHLCQRIIAYARELGVERVFTFAAMATRMRPEHPSRVFAAATDAASLGELKERDLEVLEDGQIGGLNGVLLGAAAEAGLRGACLLGEIPHVFNQLPFPKAAVAILEIFTDMADMELDLTELNEQARGVEEQLGELLSQVEAAYESQSEEKEEEATPEPAAEEERLNPAVRRRIENMFERARENRSAAFELKQELDRLGAFAEYEDRFLDLFKKTENGSENQARPAAG